MTRVSKHAVIIDSASIQSFNYFIPVLFHFKKKVEKDTRKFIRLNPRAVRNVFHELGFVYTEKMGQSFLPIVAHRMLKCLPISRAAEKCLPQSDSLYYGGLRLLCVHSESCLERPVHPLLVARKTQASRFRKIETRGSLYCLFFSHLNNLGRYT